MGAPSRIIAFTLVAAGGALAAIFSLASCGTLDPPDPEPTLVYKSEAHGCGDLSVYKWNESTTEALIVTARKDSLGLSTTPRTFRLDSVPGSFLNVRVDRYTRVTLSPYCTDVLNPDQEAPRVWRATAGTVTISLDRDSIAPGDIYKATVKLRNLHITNGTTELVLAEENFNNVSVGWYPG